MSHEKKGGRTAVSRLLFFQNCLDACGLQDLGFHGTKFTWTNKRDSGSVVQERIDRAVANAKWLDRFPENVVLYLPLHAF